MDLFYEFEFMDKEENLNLDLEYLLIFSMAFLRKKMTMNFEFLLNW